jgi:putative ABC transport system ATP-binding protein
MTDPQQFPEENPPAVAAHNLQFRWHARASTMQFPDIFLPQGEHLFIEGPSGAGKSSLLSLIAGLALPARGEIHLLGQSTNEMSGGQRDRFRADHLGVIFQQFNLVPYLSVLDNVTLPCRLSRPRKRRCSSPGDAAGELLTRLDLPASLWSRKVTALSVGQQQRVAAARALIGTPGVILADEPTSALDSANRDRFMELLLALAGEHETSVVFVSHDPSLASRFDNHLRLEATP